MGNTTVKLTLVSYRDGLLNSVEGHKLTKNNWSGTISSQNQKDVFLAVTSNTLPEGKDAREITVQLFAMEGATANNEIDAGMWERQSNETSVVCNLLDEQGNQVATDTVNYPA